jgi:hypothetical protein
MKADSTTPPTPERLAAYADGELHGPERDAVEAWLERSPQARAEVEAFRHLACHCRRTVAAEPSPDAWDKALHRLHTALERAPRSLPSPRPARRPLVAAIAAAAAVLVVFLTGRGLWTPLPGRPPTIVNPTIVNLTGPLDLADARDVEIISMDGEDTRTLLVGRPPVHDALLLAGPGDVTLVGIEPVDGIIPGLRHNGPTPMIVAPRAADAP